MEIRTIYLDPKEFCYSEDKRRGPWAGDGTIKFSRAPRKGWVSATLVRDGTRKRISIVWLDKLPTELAASVAERPEEEPTGPDETIYT